MKRSFSLFVIVLVTCTTSIASGSITVDIGANLPAAVGGTTTLADGTTIALTEFTGGPNGGLGSTYPNNQLSDFDFATQSPGAGNWSFVAVNVTFGTDFGVSGDGVVSAADFELGVSSLNGLSNWYEFGFLDLNGAGGTNNIAPSDVIAYLNTQSNYDDPNTFVDISGAVGAVVGNSDHNNFDAAGAPTNGTGSTNDVWNNTEFGLAATDGITGFTFYYGAVTSDDRSSSPGGSIGSVSDEMNVQGVPEPGSLVTIVGLFGLTMLRRRRR